MPSPDPGPSTSRDLMALLISYGNEDGLCYCGKRRGHAGWLVCVTDHARESGTS